MSTLAIELIVRRVKITHSWLIKVTENLTEEELCQAFGPTAPPIGWHLWHIARWTDRLQASLPHPHAESAEPPNPNRGIWERARLAEQWNLTGAKLGRLEGGACMAFEDAARLPQQIGKAALLTYARRVFAATDEALASLSPAHFTEPRSSIFELTFDKEIGTLRRAPGAETTLLADLVGLHYSHTSRHLGSIEALVGLFQRKGSVSY
jgi:hypothetical protein